MVGTWAGGRGRRTGLKQMFCQRPPTSRSLVYPAWAIPALRNPFNRPPTTSGAGERAILTNSHEERSFPLDDTSGFLLSSLRLRLALCCAPGLCGLPRARFHPPSRRMGGVCVWGVPGSEPVGAFS
jgi:hypothetical protein